MKIYYRPTFEIVDIKYELVAGGGQGFNMPYTNHGAQGVTDDPMLDDPEEEGWGGYGGNGNPGDEGDAAGYRGLWD